jgi:formate dehydrogenase subunit gamma
MSSAAHVEPVPAGQIRRYTFHERACHWVSGFVYTYCLATGMAFYTPHLFWMAVVLGGAPTSRFWHPILGVVFFLVSMWMHAIWRKDMVMGSASDRAWMDNVKYYVTNQDERLPPQGRFNAGQKGYFWAMFYGTIFLLLSGLVMWFPEYVPFHLAWIRRIAILIHEAAAFITIGAFIVHVYMAVFMMPQGILGMMIGYAPRAWAREHHRLWYDEVTKGEPGNP